VKSLRGRLGASGLLAVAIAMFGAVSGHAEELPIVAVTAISEHPALDACRDGVRDALKSAGYEDGRTLEFIYENARGDLASATDIARKFAQQKPAVIVPISTPSAQAVLSATIGTPVVFAAVTDPLGAQLVRDLNAPGGTVTGVSDLAPVKKQIELIRSVTPAARRIGLLYNPRESNSYTLANLMKVVAQTVDMTIVEARATKSTDVQAAAESLVGRADVIFVPTDNTIVSALDGVIDVAAKNRLPVFAGDTESVKRGALAGIGLDYYKVGWQAGNIVARILGGEAPGKIPVAGAKDTVLYINNAAAATLDITFPDVVIRAADKVIE
jgi:putative ABC transport system substrate-binding protein